MKKFIICWLAFLPLAGIGQDSLNVRALFHWEEDTIPPSSLIDNPYNEIWGYTDSVGNEYAIIGSSVGTHIFDVTDAVNSHEVVFIPGRIQGPSLIHRDFHDYEQYLYIVADEGMSSLQIADLRFLPDSAPLVYDSDSLIRQSHNIFIDVVGKKLYTCGGVSIMHNSTILTTNHLSVFSLENPVKPELLVNCRLELGFWNTIAYVHDIYVQNDTAYCHAGTKGFFIVDFSDTSDIQLIGSLTQYPQQGYNHSGWLSPNGSIYAMSDETWGMDMKILDISDLNNIQVIDTIGSDMHPLAMSHNLIFRENYLFVSHFVDGLYIFDLSDPHNIVLAGYYDTSTRPHESQKWEGAWGVYPFLSSGKVLISDMQTGLWVLDASDAITLDRAELPEITTPSPFPNPFTDQVGFRFPGNTDGCFLSLTDLRGRIIATVTAAPGQKSIALDLSIPPGMYVWSIRTKDEIYSGKLVKH
jgi:choice-of-anchor B domain-containing protein